MAQSFVRVPVDGLGKLIDTWVTAVALQHRQAIVIGDPSTDANVISISSRLRLPVELENIFDFDTGGGTDDTSAVGLVLPGSGGAVVAGIVTQPLFVRLSDGAAAITTLPISAASLPLPTGASTSANQQTDALTDTQLRATAVPVSAASLPLPTGAATEATLSSLNAKVTAVNTGAVVISSALPAGSNNIGDVDVVSSALPTGASTAALQQNDALTDAQLRATAVPVTANAGTNLNTSALATEATLASIDGKLNESNDATVTTGDEAHDAADAGNPNKLGAKALSYGTNPTGVANNDRTNLYSNIAGILHVLGGHPNIITLEVEYTAAQTNAAIITIGASTKIVVTQIQALVDEATTVAVGLRVGFAAATTPTTTGVVLTHPGLVPGSGISRGDGSGVLGVGADGEDLRITSEVPTSGALRILVSYFTIES